MFTSKSAAPIRNTLLGVAGVLTAGCATTAEDPLMQFHGDTVRRLTSECYWQKEGERLVFGGYQVHSACRKWAERRVAVRFPEAPRIYD